MVSLFEHQLDGTAVACEDVDFVGSPGGLEGVEVVNGDKSGLGPYADGDISVLDDGLTEVERGQVDKAVADGGVVGVDYLGSHDIGCAFGVGPGAALVEFTGNLVVHNIYNTLFYTLPIGDTVAGKYLVEFFGLGDSQRRFAVHLGIEGGL